MILNLSIYQKKQFMETKFNPSDYKRPLKLRSDLINANKKIVLKKGSKINFVIAKKLFDDGLKNIALTQIIF